MWQFGLHPSLVWAYYQLLYPLSDPLCSNSGLGGMSTVQAQANLVVQITGFDPVVTRWGLTGLAVSTSFKTRSLDILEFILRSQPEKWKVVMNIFNRRIYLST